MISKNFGSRFRIVRQASTKRIICVNGNSRVNITTSYWCLPRLRSARKVQLLLEMTSECVLAFCALLESIHKFMGKLTESCSHIFYVKMDFLPLLREGGSRIPMRRSHVEMWNLIQRVRRILVSVLFEFGVHENWIILKMLSEVLLGPSLPARRLTDVFSYFHYLIRKWMHVQI